MYLGLDIGTTSTKAILIDAAQRTLARAEASYPTAYPAPGLAEQDPAHWIEATRQVCAALASDAPAALARVAAVGMSGQMHSLVALGQGGRPLRPAILWSDTRGAPECRALMRDVQDIGRISGVIAMPSFTAPKLLWLRRHEPQVFDRLRLVLLPKDYVRLWLTGEGATDMSDASGAQLLDGANRAWSRPIMEAVGLAPEQLPLLLEGSAVSGRLRHDLASDLGLPAGIPVAAGGGDVATGALGAGCVDHGASLISLGTGSNIVVAQDRYAPRPETILHDFAHCVPGRWYQMAGMLNGAGCLAWAARLTGEPDIGGLLRRVEARYTGPSRVMFLPYLSGERTPHNDAAIRGGFTGLDHSTDAVDMAQAVIEGIAFSLRDAMLALEAAGCPCPAPGFIGGGTRSALWSRIVASVLRRPIVVYDESDLGPALGAARLAMLCESGADLAAVALPPPVKRVVEPDAALVDAYARRHRTFAALYPALKGLP